MGQLEVRSTRYGKAKDCPGAKGDGNVKRVDASRWASLALCAVNNQGGSNRSRMRGLLGNQKKEETP